MGDERRNYENGPIKLLCIYDDFIVLKSFLFKKTQLI